MGEVLTPEPEESIVLVAHLVLRIILVLLISFFLPLSFFFLFLLTIKEIEEEIGELLKRLNISF